MWNYLLESFRNKKNRPLSFFVNWIGMTLGLAAVIVIYLFIMQEVRHDKAIFEGSVENVYRCEINEEMGAITPSALKMFLREMPQVETTTNMMVLQQVVATEGLATNKKIKMNLLFADTVLFDVLPFKLVAGTKENAFDDPASVVVSRETAQKLFDTQDVIGRSVKINDQVTAVISAVSENIPENSTFSPDMLVQLNVLDQLWGMDHKRTETHWGHWNYETYVKLRQGADIDQFKKKYDADVRAAITKAWGNQYEDKINIRPFEDVYFAFNAGFCHAKTVDKDAINVMIFIALLVLVIAVINYVNIYTARSTEVIRSMGIKAIMGAKRMQLIGFVIADSVAITFLSALTAYCVAGLLQPIYPSIIGAEVSFDLSWDMMLALFVAIPIVCGVVSGIFPALVFTRLKPLDAMANRSSGNRTMGRIRNALIVFQFAISIALIGCTLFINKQMDFISSMNLGYDRENIYVIEGSNFMGAKFPAWRTKLLTNPNISQVSMMKNNPIEIGEFRTQSWGETNDESMTVNVQWADQYALSLLKVSMVEGDSLRDETEKNAETRSFIINETFANKIRQQIPDVTFPFKQFAGVFKDYQANSVKEEVAPLVIGSIWRGNPNPYGTAYIKINSENLTETLKFIEKTFNELYPDQLYESAFLDKQFDDLYKTEQLFRSRLFTFSLLAVFIGCLGLFALVGYSVERRRKEIALRKVYGSTIGQIIGMLSLDFLKWLVISFVIAVPVIYYVANMWIDQFTYKTNLSWWVYALSLLVALVVAMATVFSQAYGAATENPAKAIKSE